MDGADAPRGEAGRAIVLDPVALAAACLGFDGARPEVSARRTWRYPQLLAGASLAVAAALAAAQLPTLAFGVLHFAAVSIFAATILWRLAAAASAAPLHSPLAAPGPIYTILCPLYREANVVAELVAALARLDYPGLMHQSVKSDTGGLSARCTGSLLKELTNVRDYRGVYRAMRDWNSRDRRPGGIVAGSDHSSA